MRPEALFDLSSLTLDFDKPLYDIHEVRKVNPQRHEMEQLSGIVHIDHSVQGLIGFKDVTEDEFWVRGHMPAFPLMPGVVLCECAAQLAGFYARKFDLLAGDFLGFGGMTDVRFRLPVFPNSRLILMVKVVEIRVKRRAEFAFQGYVNDRLVFSGGMIGVPISREKRADE